MESQELENLLQRLHDGTISTSELKKLQTWDQQLLAEGDDLSSLLSDLEHEQVKTRLWEVVSEKIPDRDPGEHTDNKIINMRLFWAAAVGLAVIGGWLLWQQRAEKVEGKDLVPKSLSERYHNDVAPGGDRAILTLDNGTTIDLTSAQNGTLDVSSGAVAQKEKQGELTYYARPIKPGVHTYHLVTTPRGGQYRLTLSDGTIVWLNAASSLRYPVVFAGPTRHVELTGEAYFEVKPDELKPFIVKTAASQVKVLGTAFNLNTYADEPDQRITLVHGSVEISRDNARQRLKPGEQAQINNAGQIHVMAASDIESVTAWKEGSFVFRDSPIGPLLRQLARWYNINITIEQPVTQKFTVDISRTESLSQVLQLLEMTGGVHFTIDGSNVGVQP